MNSNSNNSIRTYSSLVAYLLFGTFLFAVQQSFARLFTSPFDYATSIQLSQKDTTTPNFKKQSISLSAKAARKMIKHAKKHKAYLIDVRTPEEFKVKHIRYAQNIDYKSRDFIEKIASLDQNKPLYLYCRSGHRSGKAADTLHLLGNKRAISIGALDSLIKIGLPFDSQ